MSEGRLSIRVDEVHVPEDYVRPVDEAAALLLARQMEAEGQKTPIAVYRSTAREGGRKPYTLVYGARRLWAAAHLGWGEIDAVLRTKAEAPMLAVADNFALPTLDALEQGEHVAAYRVWWEAENGEIRRGGDQRSKVHREPLIRDLNFLEKYGFFKDLSEKFGISKATAQRLLAIGRLDRSLRDALRGTSYAKDQKHLKKLTKFGPSEQAGIAAALKFEPDLDTVLRMADPAAGRKSVGRMETGDWREKRFRDAWDDLPKDRLASALDSIGAMPKLVERWPDPLPVRGVRAQGNASPLWDMGKDPYTTLYVALTVAEIEAAKRLYAQEEQEEVFRRDLEIFEKINANEKVQRAAHEQKVAKAKAAKSRKPKRGRPADTPEIKRQKSFQKWFIPELATNMLEREEVGVTHWTVKYCRKLDAKEQFWVACHLGNGHRVDDIPWRVERSREDEASERGLDQN